MADSWWPIARSWLTHPITGSSISRPAGSSRAGRRISSSLASAPVLSLRPLAALILALTIAGCGSRMSPPGGLAGAPAAPAAVERFLQLAGDDDYTGMGWVFGTSEGAILTRDPPAQVEQRMYAIASILEHDGFVVGNGSPVPGRLNDAIVFDVIITEGTRDLRVPFTTVRGPGGRWFVEQVDIEAVTGQ